MHYPYAQKRSGRAGKGSLLLLFSISIFAFSSLRAQITQSTPWTKAYDQVSGACTGVSFAVATGTNRILVVSISHTLTASATQANPTVITYGGVTLTNATTNGTSSGRMHTWIYYLKDNAIMNGSPNALNVTLGGTHVNVTVWYAVYSGVDQTPASYTTGNGFSNTAASGPAQLSAAMAVNANQQAIYYSCIYSGNSTVPTYSINANWTSGGSSTGSSTVSWKNEPANRILPAANTTDNAATSSIAPAGQIRYAMSAMSLPVAVAITPTLTISNPTTAVVSATRCAPLTSVTVHAFNIVATGGTSILTNFQFTTTGTYVSSDLSNYKIWANSTNALGTATLLSTNASPGGAGVNTFPVFSYSMSGGTYYFWITADLPALVVAGHTLTVSGSLSTDMVTTAVRSGGPTSASGTQTLSQIPAAPGVISGPSAVAPNTGGAVYSISSVAGATTYTWLVPTGWNINIGNGTTSITVTSGNAGQNGNISVAAGNSCGTSSASTLAVSAMVPNPHNTCSQCHITHTGAGGGLTNVAGNANLCISCHNPAGAASASPFANTDKAIPGTSGTSHAWDALAVNTLYETNLPSNNEMLLRIPSGQIICSTCHDQHSQANPPYLRASNASDIMCKDCHSSRNVGTYGTNNSANKGSHPVGITYNSANSGYLPAPVAPLALVNSKVECSSCHTVHFAGSTDGNILKATNNNALCTSCHVESNATITMVHKGFGCKTCHDSHNPDKANILLIGSNITTPNSGLLPVVFNANLTAGNYADGSAPYNGICEVCHTTTDHYRNTAGGTPDSRHMPATQKCVDCHPHNKGFSPVTDCFSCHNAITDKAGVGPAGGRRQIVDNLGTGAGTGGDFKRTSHHVTGSIPSVSDCIKCHYMGDHMQGTVKLLDPDMGYLNVITYDPLNKSSVESFCLKCHDSNGANGDLTPFSDNVSVPVIDASMWAASSHKTNGTSSANTCLGCHDNGHGSNKSNLIGPFAYAGPGTGTDLMNEEEGFCFTCHGSAGPALQVHLAFGGTNTATSFYKHDPSATYRKHLNSENTGAAFGGTNRHVECVDCHNPHGAKAGTATAPTILPTLVGAEGVEPTYAGAGAPTGFTWQSAVTQEYQVCYKCHSSFTTLPTYLPSGWNTTIQADGLKKLTTGGTNTQIADSRDMAQEYNPNNQSFHPVMAVGKNPGILATAFQTGWTATSRVYCTSCHNSNVVTTGYGRGPHGSANLHLLDAGTGASTTGFKTVHNGVNTPTTDFCTKCHQATAYISNNTGSRFAYHMYHVANKTQEGCYICHDTHGSEQFHLINFNRNEYSNRPTNTTFCITSVGTNTQAAFVHAAGTGSNSCTITCHGTSHGTGKLYNPTYN